MTERIVAETGVDLSTSAVKVGVRSADGEEDFTSCDIRGATRWLGQPAFFLEHLPALLLGNLQVLEARGWAFWPPGALSFSVRQHDLVVLGLGGALLMPALSWECDAATAEAEALERAGADRTVGRIEPRFVLPKLLWVLRQTPGLRTQTEYVVTTGDYIAWKLTGQLRLSTSEALSNALLDQTTRQLAAEVIGRAGVPPEWFPPTVTSGTLVGLVSPLCSGIDSWSPVRELLRHAAVYAGLGDNFAGSVGSGLTEGAIVISAGSSGTVCRLAAPDARLAGRAATFEFYTDRLLLMMLKRCSLWYADFLRSGGLPAGHGECNRLALQCDVGRLALVREGEYPEGWQGLDADVRIATIQFSIALELLRLVKAMLGEVLTQSSPVTRFVLTGGLSQSPFFLGVMDAGLGLLAPGATLSMSTRQGELASQNATFGALINAHLRGQTAELGATVQRLGRFAECPGFPTDKRERVAAILRPRFAID